MKKKKKRFWHRQKLSECITQRKGYCFVKYEIISSYRVRCEMYLLLCVTVIKNSKPLHRAHLYYHLPHISSWVSFRHLNSTSSKPNSLSFPLTTSSLSRLIVNIKPEICQQSPAPSIFSSSISYHHQNLWFWLLTISQPFLHPHFHSVHFGTCILFWNTEY